MHDVTSLDCSRIAQDLQIRKVQVESVVALFDEGNTIPFITRYRKERTGGLDEEILRQIQARLNLLRQLAERRQTILKSIETQGKLTEDLRVAIQRADSMKRLEDLYLPYKPKKRTLATTARDKGLEPLALAIWNRDPAVANLGEVLPAMVNPEKELNTPEDILTGVKHILAEVVAETADVRAAVRCVLWETGKLTSIKSEKVGQGQGLEYKDYFQFTEPARLIPPHRILALNRGEKEGVLKVSLQWNADAVREAALHLVAETAPGQASPEPPPAPVSNGQPPENAPAPAAAETAPPSAPAEGELLSPRAGYRTPHAALLREVVDDALTRLLLPSLEREIRRELTEEAENHAVGIFARNLRSLLLQPPLRGRRVLAIDPGFRTGCKVVALDERGTPLEQAVVFLQGAKKERPPRPAAPAPAAPPETAAAPDPAGTAPASAEPQAPLSADASASGETPSAPVATAQAEAPPVPATQPPPEPVAASSPAAVETAPVPEPAPAAATEAQRPAEQPALAETPLAVSRREEAKTKLHELITKHHLNLVAIGNGTGCRETEELVSELIAQQLPELAYVIVNEAGASVYSASSVAREEFPDFDATLRGTISIGRRLQDPLSELVKVDPQNIGVGLYQHDVNPKYLKESLDTVVESCVNQVGVDLNTASVPLLRHVSGLNQMVARELVDYRKHHGPFTRREQLLQVPSVGPARYVQAAGFLKIPGGENPLDTTWIHPESYTVAQQLLAEMGYGPDVVGDASRAEEFRTRLKGLSPEELARRLETGVPTVHDILDALARPGRDPREDLPPPIFKKGVLKLEDLQPGMELKGTVLNVVDFGAFVDIGLKDSGLVHISQMANRYIRSPYDVASVGDIVTVWVLNVDLDRRRVSLTMIAPGTKRKPPERKPAPPREQKAGGGPPRGRRPQGGRPEQQGAGAAPPPRGRRRPPRKPLQTPPAAAGVAAETPSAQAPAARPSRPAQPPPPPRRPRREAPRPKLSQAALEGRVPLRTFGELSALFAAKKTPPRERPPSEPAPAPEPSVPQEASEKVPENSGAAAPQ
jgi:protein Tex